MSYVLEGLRMPDWRLARLFVVAHRACLELLFAISIASLLLPDFTVSAVHQSLDQGGALRPSISPWEGSLRSDRRCGDRCAGRARTCQGAVWFGGQRRLTSRALRLPGLSYDRTARLL